MPPTAEGFQESLQPDKETDEDSESRRTSDERVRRLNRSDRSSGTPPLSLDRRVFRLQFPRAVSRNGQQPLPESKDDLVDGQTKT